MDNKFKIVPVQMSLDSNSNCFMSKSGGKIYEEEYTSLEEAKKAINPKKWSYVIVIDESKKELVHFECESYCLTKQKITN